MPRMSARAIAEKQARNTAASQQDYVAGINAVTVAPGAQAAAKADVYLARVQEKVDKYKRNVAAVSLESWKGSAVAKASRLGQGANAAIEKTTQFWDSFGPHLDSGVAKVKGMPNTSLEDRINRSVAMMRHNSTYKRS